MMVGTKKGISVLKNETSKNMARGVLFQNTILGGVRIPV